MNEITTPDVALICGLTYRQVDYLWRRGLVGDGTNPGSGVPRRWTFPDVLRAAAYGSVTGLVGSLEVDIAADLFAGDVETDEIAVLAAGPVAVTVDLADLRRRIRNTLAARRLITADRADDLEVTLGRLAG